MPGPEGGLDRLLAFFARCNGLSFCYGRPACSARKHGTVQYEFEEELAYGWSWCDDHNDWYAAVGVLHQVGIELWWSTGRITVACNVEWSARSVENLIEASALAQETYGEEWGWRRAELEVGPRDSQGRERTGADWGLEPALIEPMQILAPEDTRASHPGERWYADESVAVHCWSTTQFLPVRREVPVVFAWYRNLRGRRRIEAVTGPVLPS